MLIGLNKIVKEIILKHNDFGMYGEKLLHARKRMKSGLDVYLFSNIEGIEYKQYKVVSQDSRVKYHVNLSDWSCECPDFNQNCYPCKHIFGTLFLVVGDDLVEYKTMNPFEFMKKVRLLLCEDNELMVKLIKLNEFPVTIGEDALEELKSKNRRLQLFLNK